MKWFKHFTDNHRGQSVQILLDELGHMGLCYFLLVEMCAEKLEPRVDQKLTEVDCEFNFHRRVVQQNLRIRPAGLQRLLNCCATTGLLTFDFTGNSLRISMPILLDLLDSDSKKARSRRANAAAKSRLDKDIDKEEDKDKDIVQPAGRTRPSFDFTEVYDRYPRKQGKSEGLARCKAQIKTPEDFAKLRQAVDRYRSHVEREGIEPQFIKLFSSFMSGWQDWLDPDVGTATVNQPEDRYAFLREVTSATS